LDEIISRKKENYISQETEIQNLKFEYQNPNQLISPNGQN